MNRSVKTLLHRYPLLAALPAVILGLAVLVAHAATAPAGVVLLASGTANAQSTGGAARALNRRAEVFVGDRITTGQESQLQLRMKDGAMVALGANAEFVVNAYSDDAAGDQKDQAVLSLVKGGLRTISGQIDKSTYSMNTPTATLGIRGTVFDVFVRDDGSTIVILRDGVVVLTAKTGGQVLLNKPGLSSIVTHGNSPTPPGTPPADVLDYLRGILPSLPENTDWDTTGNTAVGTDIINIINDRPLDINGDGDVPGIPAGGSGCSPNDTACFCRLNPYQC